MRTFAYLLLSALTTVRLMVLSLLSPAVMAQSADGDRGLRGVFTVPGSAAAALPDPIFHYAFKNS